MPRRCFFFFLSYTKAFHVSQKKKNTKSSFMTGGKESIHPIRVNSAVFFFCSHQSEVHSGRGDGEESREAVANITFNFGFMILHCDLRSTSFLLPDAFCSIRTKTVQIFLAKHKIGVKIVCEKMEMTMWSRKKSAKK